MINFDAFVHTDILNGLAKVENQSFNNCAALRAIFPVIGTSTYSIAKFRVFSFSDHEALGITHRKTLLNYQASVSTKIPISSWQILMLILSLLIYL